jgi:hypothetical protein
MELTAERSPIGMNISLNSKLLPQVKSTMTTIKAEPYGFAFFFRVISTGHHLKRA